jgi:hypothetical protein
MTGRRRGTGFNQRLAYSAVARGFRIFVARDAFNRSAEPDVEPLRLPPVAARRHLPWFVWIAIVVVALGAMYLISKGADRPADPYTRPPVTTAPPSPGK